jgi:hypothetical protein
VPTSFEGKDYDHYCRKRTWADAFIKNIQTSSSISNIGIEKQETKKEKMQEKLTNLCETFSGGSSESESDEDNSEESCDIEVMTDESSIESDESCDSTVHQQVLFGKDGTQWTEITHQQAGRLQSQNIFRNKPGTTSYCRTIQEPIDAFRLFLDDGLLRHIKNCSLEYANNVNLDPSSPITLFDIEAFIGLLFIKGAMNQANFPYDLLWSDNYGCEKFKRTMSRNRFRHIKRCLRFDQRSTRSQRLEDDKYALMSFVHYRMVENFQKAYIPSENLTVDEQLFPTKSRCRFTQYMPQKPDKFGIKFWILCEVESKYCLNIRPYLGKDETRVGSLGEHVVTSLIQPYMKKGYNMTCDNFFTNLHLAKTLVKNSTSIVGTVRSNRRELPPAAFSKLPLYESQFFQHDHITLISYQARKNKKVHLLSTLHPGSSCDSSPKKKPEAIGFYNITKCGVDVLDAMCKAMTTKIGSRRWTLSVFCNLLDIAAINAWIIFKKETSSKISRRMFLLQLGDQMTKGSEEIRAEEPSAGTGRCDQRIYCKVRLHCHKNKTKTVCEGCKTPMCGPCQAKICQPCYLKMPDN